MVQIVMKNVEKKFGNEVVIPDMNLTVNDKEFLVLVGPSGCGKSTMLNLIAGLEYPTDGTIHFDNQEVTYINPRDRNIAMVFQSYALYPHMDVYQNMSFSLRLAKMDPGEIRKRVDKAAKILQIEELISKKPKQMSGGQRQRVALGRAIVRDPSIFLLDEPLSNLDAKLRVEMRAEIIRLQKTLETTLAYVTHDQVEAMSMADRIAIINKGKIQQVGSPFEVYNFPANLFVGGFIGSPQMSFLDGTLESDSSSVFVNFIDHKMKLSGIREAGAKRYLDYCESNNKKPKIRLGIRPEHLITGYKEEDTFLKRSDENYDTRLEKVERSSENVVRTGTVFVVEHLGAGTYVTVDIKSNNGKQTDRVGIMVDGYFPAKINAQLPVRFDEPYSHIFDVETEDSILALCSRSTRESLMEVV